MFGTGHPQPPHRKEVAMQVVQQRQRDFDAHHLQVEPPGGDVAPAPALPAIEFEVSYTLREYLGFLRDHLAFVTRRQPRAVRLRQALVPAVLALAAGAGAWLAGPGLTGTLLAAAALLALAFLPVTLDAWVALVGTPVFYLKKRRMPVCAFRIDGTGVARTTRAGTFKRAWTEIDGVRRYRHGFLLMTGKGGMPVPYRCMDARQAEALRRFRQG